MDDHVDNLTLKVLEKIQATLARMEREAKATNQRLDKLTDRVEAGFGELNERVDVLTERVDGLSNRIDGVLKIVGTHHQDHERRLQRIEKHLKIR